MDSIVSQMIANIFQNEVYCMDQLIIRQGTQKDLKNIQHVLVASQWFTYHTLFSKTSIQKIIDRYYNTERLSEEIACINATWHGYIVAEIHGEIVGVIGGGMRDEYDGEVYVLYLHPEKRLKGVGTQLLNKFTHIQKFTYGANEQWVAVAKGNIYGIPFYEARGFEFQYESASYAAIDDNDISLWYKRKI